MRYAHTNLIANDWRGLAAFYVDVFACVALEPERSLEGEWLAAGTGVPHAALQGVHLRLPGHGPTGPTLEIFRYAANEASTPGPANRVGLGHLAFEVDDVAKTLEAVIAAGGRAAGEVVAHSVEGAGQLTFVYCRDPEGNLIELQSWA